MTGKTMFETNVSGMQKLEVDTKGFQKGMYVVQIKIADFTVSKRLIIEK